MKNETQEITSRCAMEARKLVQDVEAETQNLDTVEREAMELLKVCSCFCQPCSKIILVVATLPIIDWSFSGVIFHHATTIIILKSCPTL